MDVMIHWFLAPCGLVIDLKSTTEKMTVFVFEVTCQGCKDWLIDAMVGHAGGAKIADELQIKTHSSEGLVRHALDIVYRYRCAHEQNACPEWCSMLQNNAVIEYIAHVVNGDRLGWKRPTCAECGRHGIPHVTEAHAYRPVRCSFESCQAAAVLARGDDPLCNTHVMVHDGATTFRPIYDTACGSGSMGGSGAVPHDVLGRVVCELPSGHACPHAALSRAGRIVGRWT